MSVEQDRAEIVRLHEEWWASDHSIPRMRPCFPEGDAYLMYNVSGHPYYGIDEKVVLWKHYQGRIECPEPPKFSIERLEIRGDMAWLAAVGTVKLQVVGPAGTGSGSFQPPRGALPIATAEPSTEAYQLTVHSTEVYQRDDGAGKAVWKMWHFHGSSTAPVEEPRPAFGDTFVSRGTLPKV